MKKDIHPESFTVEVENISGEKFNLSSTKKGSIIVNSSRSTHSAWTGEIKVKTTNKKAAKISEFF